MKRYTKEDIEQLERDIIEMQAVLRESKLSTSAKQASKNLAAWPSLNNNNNPYNAYRFGVAMAGAPQQKTDKSGPIGGDFITVAYSNGDDEILKSAAKQMGINHKQLASKKSKETDDVHKVSPVAAAKRNKYGI